ncbi:MAG: hypothetical protein CTY38_10130 [Methylotenera sp.]|nr:MAG: hypothetical protein CTY38_10130 [Methylotenera sp.]
MMEWEAHLVEQIAANAGLEASARIKTIAIARKHFIMNLLYHFKLVSTSFCWFRIKGLLWAESCDHMLLNAEFRLIITNGRKSAKQRVSLIKHFHVFIITQLF